MHGVRVKKNRERIDLHEIIYMTAEIMRRWTPTENVCTHSKAQLDTDGISV